jgi:PhoH-like ATPase
MSEQKKPKTFVLDTSPLLFDPERVLTSFQDNTVVLPLIVLAELDKLKNHPAKGEKARAVIHRLNELIGRRDIITGIDLPGGGILRVDTDGNYSGDMLPKGLDPNKPDNMIIMTAKAIAKARPETEVILVTNDVSMRIIAKSQGVNAQDYKTGKIPEKIQTGSSTVELGVPDETISLIYQPSYKYGLPLEQAGISSEESSGLNPNACLRLVGKQDGRKALAIFDKNGSRLHLVPKLKNQNERGSGISPRNEEQAFALAMACYQNARIVTLSGRAGTGKSFMALLAGWTLLHSQKQRDFEAKAVETAESGHHDTRMIVFRPTREVGPELGFLPGTLEEKIAPWAQPVWERLNLIASENASGTDHLEALIRAGRIQILSITHLRGATLDNAYIVVDDAQNYDPDEMKTLVTRVGEGARIVLTGDPSQVDTSYLDAYSNGFSHVISKFTGRDMHGHVGLVKGERSPLAELAAEIL